MTDKDRARQAPAPVEVSRLAEEVKEAVREHAGAVFGDAGVDRCVATWDALAAAIDRLRDLAIRASTPVGEVPAGKDSATRSKCADCMYPNMCRTQGYRFCAASPAPVASKGAEAVWTPEQIADVEAKGAELRARFKPATVAPPSEPEAQKAVAPIDMVLHCPACGLQHIDAPEQPTITSFGYAWTNPPHRSHLCHGCGHIWRPADVPTNGVAAIKTRGQNDSPSPATSMEVQGRDEAWTRAMNAALTYRNHDPEAMDEQDAWANLVNAIGALAGRLGEGRG